MRLDQMSPAPGSRKERKRVGRGPGSGTGKTAGRGHKGYGSRSGSGTKPGFEGGQNPLARRLPKRGFKNHFRRAYQVVNLDDLGRFEAGGEVTLDTLRDHGLAKRSLPVKVLGGGELKNGLTVKVQAFSKSAAEAIKGAGGSTEVVAYREAKGD
ncbi:MAG: 50S ribosomal protein L15 [Deltaproteobacteria bacterium]